MDSETSAPVTGAAGMPKNVPFGTGTADRVGGAAAMPDHSAASLRTTALVESRDAGVGATDGDRAGVFGRLVKDDGDIAGLVAYSIYKQNKLDWLKAFETTLGRSPQDAELASYIIGEATPRRLATYRHLAEATLAGQGPEVPAPGQPFATGSVGGYRRRVAFGDATRLTTGLIATYAVIAILFVVAFWLAAHYTMSNR